MTQTQLWTAFIIIIIAALLYKFADFLEEKQQEKNKRRQRARSMTPPPPEHWNCRCQLPSNEKPLSKDEVMKLIDERLTQILNSQEPLK